VNDNDPLGVDPLGTGQMPSIVLVLVLVVVLVLDPQRSPI
jgi:hypothetical protein